MNTPENGGHAAVDPVDQSARAAIVAERERNVWVVAGAGTGKTRTIIDRAIDLLAPAGDAVPVPITRLAAITFTRRAAGELRFRLRERLLGELQRVAAAGGERVGRLSDALSNLDAAFIGTIHGFADRLLRLRPVEAQLSPAYVLVEDNEALVHETFLRLRRGAEAGTLAGELGDRVAAIAPELLAEAAETLRAATRAGLQMERRENAFGSVASVESMLASMVDTRDVRVPLPPIPDPGLDVAQAAARRAHDMLRMARGSTAGHRRVRRVVRALQHLAFTDDPAEAFRIVAETRRGRDLYQREFDGDSVGYSIYAALRDGKPGSLAEQLQGPHRWLAARLVRLFPVVAAMYERVKDDHEVVDYLDLLIKLRNLLRDDRDARAFYQARFDHLFVDEFQDTDPLQCEIVFYLCEQGTAATDWAQVDLTPGKLTIVGDPKQSIYRFRRADIAMYGRAGGRVVASGALQQRLETNFRSRPELIDFFNAQLAGVLGKGAGEAFDPTAGRAHYEPLRAAAAIAAGGVCVHLLPYAGAGGERLLAGNGRAVEGAAVARYIRWLLASGHPVRDPETDVERPVRPGDIAVLAPVTTQLRHLLRPLDELGIEYTARGGVLFLAHPTVRRFLLALRALADRDDGVAMAALLQPPFFATSWPDVLAARSGDAAPCAGGTRVTEARAIIAQLRAARHLRAPGATARDLIERTALGRWAVTARNGRQLLAALYEVAAELDRRAAIDGLDFDAATEIVRGWAASPVYLDAPEPLGAGAVRVQTIHQAKGLEFPVVIVWDGFQTLSDRGNATWQVDRDGNAWALRLGQIAVEHPPDSGVLRREGELGEHERRRLYYVAATRARDLLVLPLPATKSERLQYATRELAANVRDDLVLRLAPFVPGAEPEWAAASPPGGSMTITGDAGLQMQVVSAAERLNAAVAAQVQPRALPVAVTAAAAAGEEPDARAAKVAGARYGKAFGLVVHRALELHLCGACADPDAAVRFAMAEVGDRTYEHEARADVERALAALSGEGIAAAGGWQLQVEFPLCAARPGGLLVSGLIDLLGVRGDAVVVIDFKTDQPSPGPLRAVYPTYAAQLEGYVELARASGWLAGRAVRAALLMTASGELRWLDAADDHRGGG